MPSFKTARAALLAAALGASLLGGCGTSPEERAYRERLEMGLTTPGDIQRFKVSEREQRFLVADANDVQPRFAQDKDRQLMRAAAGGDVTRIKELLARGALVNAVDEWGNTALLNAAREGEVESARMLLKAGAYVEGRGGSMPPLAAAALRGHTILVRLLLRNGANVDAVGQNELSVLMNAVKLNRLEVVKALIEAGADTRVRDRAGDNLLVVAVSENRSDMLALLLRLGVPANLADDNGLTALYWAEHLQRPELADLLRDAGADPVRKKTEIIQSRPYNFGKF